MGMKRLTVMLLTAVSAWLCCVNSVHSCLTEPLDVVYSETSASDKAKSTSKGILGSVLSSATGGAVSSGGRKETRLSRRPHYPKTKLEITDSKLELEYQGKYEDGTVQMAVRIKKDSEKGSPHLIVLQDINCNILLPAKVSVFELWGRGGLQVSWSSSTFQNGSLVSSQSGGWNTSWTELKRRYPNTSKIPGIWETYGEEPFKGIRGVSVEFQPPSTGQFNPADWYLVSHFTRRGSGDSGITTEPVVAQMTVGKKQTYVFSQADDVAWQVPLAQVTAVSLLTSTEQQGLVCKDDCKKILDEIDQLECIKEDCGDRTIAVDAALQAHKDALQASDEALNDVERATSDIKNARQALDTARAKQDQAKRKLAIETTKQKRLQDALRRGGHGLAARQSQHAIDYSQGVISRLEQRAENAGAASETAKNNLASAESALEEANAAIAAAKEAADSKQQQLEAAKQALSDCMQAERERCQAVEDLQQEYQRCARRCRAQDRTRAELDSSGEYLADQPEDVEQARDEYEANTSKLRDLQKAINEFGGTDSSAAKQFSEEAKSTREQADQISNDAKRALKDAEASYEQGDLESAEESAKQARDLQDQADETLDEAADLMQDAVDQAWLEYQKELEMQLVEYNRELRAAAEAAALKKQVCLRYISEYFDQQSNNSTLLEEMGGFVSGDAKDAIKQADGIAANPEQVKEFLAKVEKQRHKLERLLTLLNGIADNASMESRNEAFATTLEIAAELAERIPGLGEFFNFYSSAYSAAVNALYALQEKFIDLYKPMVDDYVDLSRPCCSYDPGELNSKSLEELVDERWVRFERDNHKVLARLSGDTLRKLETYFKTRLTLKWTTCCIQYTLDA